MLHLLIHTVHSTVTIVGTIGIIRMQIHTILTTLGIHLTILGVTIIITLGILGIVQVGITVGTMDFMILMDTMLIILLVCHLEAVELSVRIITLEAEETLQF